MKAAFGKIILTPPDTIIGRALCGYIPSPTCSGKLDDIYAHAVLIEDIILGNVKKHLLLISMDFLKLPLLFTEYVKEKIEEEYYIHPNQTLIHATHTHKSFDMGGEFAYPGGVDKFVKSIMFGAYNSDDKYKIWVTKQVVKMVGQMLKDLIPCKIAWTKEKIDNQHLIINRRHPSRIINQKIGLISFKKISDNSLYGIVVNFPMHPTTLNNKIDKMSADYPGKIKEKISQLSDGKVSTVFFTGAAGDVNPITTCGTNFKQLEKNPMPIYGQMGDYEHTTALGHAIGKYAFDFANNIPEKEYFDTLDFRSYSRTFWVPMNDYKKKVKWDTYVSNSIIHFLKKFFLFRIAMTMGDAKEPNFPGFAIKHKKKDINCYSTIHYIKFKGSKDGYTKELSLAGVPGELFEDIGIEICEKTPTGTDNTFVIENANDWIGYLLPLKEYISSTGWEIFASFGPLVGAYVRNNYFYLLRDIEAKTNAGYY